MLAESHLLVGPMTDDEVHAAIEEPAHRAGLTLESGLADAIAADVADQPGALPLLSTALLETWVRRRGRTLTHAGYHDAGGVGGAVARLAENAYLQLTLDEQRECRQLLFRLAEPAEDSDDVRRRVPLVELGDTPVLQTLVARRLVTTSDGAAEVADEALLREWPRLRSWLEDDRDGRRLHHRVANAAIDWDTSGRDPTELYRGTRLDAAVEWSATHPSEASPLEREFLDAADAAHDDESRACASSGPPAAVARGRPRGPADRGSRRWHGGARPATHCRPGGRACHPRRHARPGDPARDAGSHVAGNPNRPRALLGVEGRRLQPSLTTDGGLEAAITHRSPHLERVLHFDTSATYASVSDDARLLAAPGVDGNIRIYDFTTGRLLRTFRGDGRPAIIAAFNHDASLVVTGGSSGKVTVWRVASGKPIGPPVMPGGSIVYGIFDRTGELVTASDNGNVARWDLSNPDRPIAIGEPFTVQVGTNDVPVVALGGADGHFLAAGGMTEQRTTIWDVTTHRQVGTELPGTPGRFSPDGSTLATTSANRIVLWDPATGAERGTFDLGSHQAASAGPPAFSPDGRLLAVADADDNAIRVFDIPSGQPIGEPLVFHAASASPKLFLPDGRLVTAGANEAAVWQLDTLARPLETIVHANREATASGVTTAVGQFTPEGTEVITVGFGDHRVLAWDAVTGAPHGDLLGGRTVTAGIVFSPDAKIIAAAGLDGTFTLWDRIGERKLATVDTGQTGLVGVAWDPHRPTLVTTGAPGSVLFWDVSNPRHPVEQRHRALTAPAGFPYFSPDGRFLVVLGGYPTTSATVFDIATGHKVLGFAGATLPQVSFTPDSTILAAAIGQFNVTGKVVLWDTATWHRRATLTLPYSPAGVAFINGGTRFATPSILPAVGSIDLWDTATLQPVGEPLTAPTTESIFAFADAGGRRSRSAPTAASPPCSTSTRAPGNAPPVASPAATSPAPSGSSTPPGRPTERPVPIGLPVTDRDHLLTPDPSSIRSAELLGCHHGTLG